MPNLSQIYSLKRRFYQLNKSDAKVQDYIEKQEAKDVFEKAFSSGRLNENLGGRTDRLDEQRIFAFINENFNPAKPEIIKYFDESQEEKVTLLFIDITSFSKTIANWPTSKIKEYLDDYYKRIIPIIYNNGGEIEKLMGDGIICVFGKPFIDCESPQEVYHAEECAEMVIKEFYNSDKNVKVAIHQGEITYYKVPGDHYGEYTMIGQPITDLYRLESVSKSNAINFYGGSSYDGLGWTWSRFNEKIVSCRGFEIQGLQGVDFKKVKYMKFPSHL